jgi:hypothetical protein
MKELITLYRKLINDSWEGYYQEESPEATEVVSPRDIYQFSSTGECDEGPESARHLLWMLDRMDEMNQKLEHPAEYKSLQKYQQDTMKLNRWLGFVQGVLWAQLDCSLDDLRKHVREAKL